MTTTHLTYYKLHQMQLDTVPLTITNCTHEIRQRRSFGRVLLIISCEQCCARQPGGTESLGEAPSLPSGTKQTNTPQFSLRNFFIALKRR